MRHHAADPFVAAIAVAALAAGDGELRCAALGPELRQHVETARGGGTLDREATIRTLLARLAPTLPSAGSTIPVRARAMLAALAPREVGAAWLREAPRPRQGFRLSAALRATIAATEEAAWRV